MLEIGSSYYYFAPFCDRDFNKIVQRISIISGMLMGLYMTIILNVIFGRYRSEDVGDFIFEILIHYLCSVVSLFATTSQCIQLIHFTVSTVCLLLFLTVSLSLSLSLSLSEKEIERERDGDESSTIFPYFSLDMMIYYNKTHIPFR